MITQNSHKKLFLFDAFALIYRSYFAFIKNPRVTSKGLDTSAIFGLINTILEIKTKEKPTHWCFCFDSSEPTERHIEYSQYKAQRDSMPEGISEAIPYIFKILEAMNIPVLSMPGYEADDIIGTVAKKAAKENYMVYMMTPDKDFAQLVSKNINIYKPAFKGTGPQILGVLEVKKKFEIEKVSQVIDYLGMTGDASDNIPGIPGVGDKTAKKLIQEFGGVEGVYSNIEKISGKLKEKVLNNKKLCLLSKKLVTINVNVPVNYNIDNFRLEKFNIEKLKIILKTLEFNTLLSKLTPKPSDSLNTEEKINNNNENKNDKLDLFSSYNVSLPKLEKKEKNTSLFKCITDMDELNKIVSEIKTSSVLCFKIFYTDEIIAGISICHNGNYSYYVPLNTNYDKATSSIGLIINLFEDSNVLKVGHNLKHQINILKRVKVFVKGPLFDTMIASHLINSESNNNLKVLSESIVDYQIENLNYEYAIMHLIKGAPSNGQLLNYSCELALLPYKLMVYFKKELTDNDLDYLFYKVEMNLIYVLASMEETGVKIDVEYLDNFSKKLHKLINKSENEIFKLAKEKFNLSSPKQLGVVLFEKMKIIPNAKKTKSGQYSTSEISLSKISKNHPIITLILNHRSLEKLRSTYVESLPSLINKNTRKIHTTFNQSVTSTGRLSSTKPNLQNIPIKTLLGKEVRKSFIACDKNNVLISADYSQIELRIIAEMSGDDNMISAFKKNRDIHTSTAAKIFNVPIESVSKEMRSNAKVVNFGIIYGVSAFGLSQQTNLSRKEAAEIIKTYFQSFPKLKTFMDNQISFAKKYGFVKTLLNRRRSLISINSSNSFVRSHAERNAINSPIQGSAADIIKIAMVNIYKQLLSKNLSSKLIIQVHDELIFDSPIEEVSIIKSIIKKEMESAIKTTVPLTVEIGVAKNWLEAH